MFAQISSKTVVQCYRVHETYPTQKKTKKIQKDVFRKSEGISPSLFDKKSTYTAPIELFENIDVTTKHRNRRTKKKKKDVFHLCKCDEDGIDKNYNPQTWDSITNFYGNADTTEVWADPEFQIPNLQQYYKNRNKDGKHRDYSNESKKYRRRSKHKKRGHFKSEITSSFQENCPDELCAEEARYNKSYKCKCKIKKEPQLTTNESSGSFLSLNSVAKMKDKLLCICHKYSQKFNNNPNKNDMVGREETSRKKNNNDIIISRAHEIEQTGDPFFEIQVNPSDMCVLNPIEIREKILKYGRPEKNDPKCICPSRGTLKPGEVCKAGRCKKAFKNKQVGFNCWCEKKLAQCGDATCGTMNTGDTRTKKEKKRPLRYQRNNKPLLEVQLDMDKMCVVNPQEIEEKIINNMTVEDICSSGVCHEAALINKTPYFCKCIGRKINTDITECREDTCMDTTGKKKSKFSLLCNRLCCKSENWSHRNRNNNINQKRINRRSVYEISPQKLRRASISPQPGNLNQGNPKIKQENAPKLNVTQKDRNRKGNKSNLNYHDAVIPSPKPGELRPINPTDVKTSNNIKHNTEELTCACAHQCECDMDQLKLKNERYKQKQKEKMAKKRNKKVDDHQFERDLKKRAAQERKAEKKATKERMKQIKIMQKKLDEEPLDANFCTSCLLGLLKLGVGTILFIIRLIIIIIKNPKKAYWYVMDRISDPEGTYFKIKKWFSDAILIKKLQIAETVRGSDTLTILADHFLDTSFYQSFADRGQTKKEQVTFEQKSKARKRRIRRREQQAIHSCRHMLLTTLRQTPCLWVYHICPNFYPQCLSLLQFMHSFSRILLFLVAFACWTPCILGFELCRACLCCFMCTG